MPEVVEMQRAYKQADLDALKMKFRARAQLGLACIREREQANGKTTQDDIAETLNVVKEQVRRYEAACRAWQEKYPNEPLD
jgi:uncharacterized protein YicC (UPF0701 family)